MSKTKRISLITLLVTLILSMLALIVMGVGQKQAYASEPTLFAFEDGASVKIIEDGGMRFRLQMDETTASEIKGAETNELSFYVVPEKYYEENMTVSDLENLLFENCGSNKAQKVVADKNKIYKGVDANGNDGWFANCLLDINLSKYDGAYNTVNFIVFASWNGNLVESEIRNLRDVASSAALDEYYDEVTGIYTWLGSEEYALSVDTAEEMDALIQNVSKFSNMEIEVWNDFDMDGISGLPANVKLYHKVSFYNNDELMDEQWVANGESAEFDGEVPAYSSLEAMSGYVRGYKNSGTWVNAKSNGVEMDLSSITAKTNAYINWVWGQQQSNLVNDLHENEKDTIFSFDTELGVCQVYNATIASKPFESRSFDTIVKMDGQRGTTKLTYALTGVNVLYATFTTGTQVSAVSGTTDSTFDFSGYDLTNDYMVMDIYVDLDDTITKVWVGLNGTPKYSAINNGTWGKFVAPLSALNSAGNGLSSSYFTFMLMDKGSGISGGTGSIHLGKAYVVTAEEFNTIASDTTFKIGTMEMAGASVVGAKSVSSTSHFAQSYYTNISVINDELFYYVHNPSNVTEMGIYLTFATPQTGKVYFVARGLETTANAQVFVGGTHKKTPDATYEGYLPGGYDVYSFDFGSHQVDKIKLRSLGYMQQISIKDITNSLPAGMIVPAVPAE